MKVIDSITSHSFLLIGPSATAMSFAIAVVATKKTRLGKGDWNDLNVLTFIIPHVQFHEWCTRTLSCSGDKEN